MLVGILACLRRPKRPLPPNPMMRFPIYAGTFAREAVASRRHAQVRPIQAERQAMVHAALRGRA